MKSVSVRVSREELERIARLELGLVPPHSPILPLARSQAVQVAIQHVIRAVNRFDQDQYSQNQVSAATALFEAGKRLRKAIRDEQTYKGTRS